MCSVDPVLLGLGCWSPPLVNYPYRQTFKTYASLPLKYQIKTITININFYRWPLLSGVNVPAISLLSQTFQTLSARTGTYKVTAPKPFRDWSDLRNNVKTLSSAVVSASASLIQVFDTCDRQDKIWCPNMLF